MKHKKYFVIQKDIWSVSHCTIIDQYNQWYWPLRVIILPPHIEICGWTWLIYSFFSAHMIKNQVQFIARTIGPLHLVSPVAMVYRLWRGRVGYTGLFHDAVAPSFCTLVKKLSGSGQVLPSSLHPMVVTWDVLMASQRNLTVEGRTVTASEDIAGRTRAGQLTLFQGLSWSNGQQTSVLRRKCCVIQYQMSKPISVILLDF